MVPTTVWCELIKGDNYWFMRISNNARSSDLGTLNCEIREICMYRCCFFCLCYLLGLRFLMHTKVDLVSTYTFH